MPALSPMLLEIVNAARKAATASDEGTASGCSEPSRRSVAAASREFWFRCWVPRALHPEAKGAVTVVLEEADLSEVGVRHGDSPFTRHLGESSDAFLQRSSRFLEATLFGQRHSEVVEIVPVPEPPLLAQIGIRLCFPDLLVGGRGLVEQYIRLRILAHNRAGISEVVPRATDRGIVRGQFFIASASR